MKDKGALGAKRNRPEARTPGWLSRTRTALIDISQPNLLRVARPLATVPILARRVLNRLAQPLVRRRLTGILPRLYRLARVPRALDMFYRPARRRGMPPATAFEYEGISAEPRAEFSHWTHIDEWQSFGQELVSGSEGIATPSSSEMREAEPSERPVTVAPLVRVRTDDGRRTEDGAPALSLFKGRTTEARPIARIARTPSQFPPEQSFTPTVQPSLVQARPITRAGLQPAHGVPQQERQPAVAPLVPMMRQEPTQGPVAPQSSQEREVREGAAQLVSTEPHTEQPGQRLIQPSEQAQQGPERGAVTSTLEHRPQVTGEAIVSAPTVTQEPERVPTPSTISIARPAAAATGIVQSPVPVQPPTLPGGILQQTLEARPTPIAESGLQSPAEVQPALSYSPRLTGRRTGRRLRSPLAPSVSRGMIASPPPLVPLINRTLFSAMQRLARVPVSLSTPLESSLTQERGKYWFSTAPRGWNRSDKWDFSAEQAPVQPYGTEAESVHPAIVTAPATIAERRVETVRGQGAETAGLSLTVKEAQVERTEATIEPSTAPERVRVSLAGRAPATQQAQPQRVVTVQRRATPIPAFRVAVARPGQRLGRRYIEPEPGQEIAEQVTPVGRKQPIATRAIEHRGERQIGTSAIPQAEPPQQQIVARPMPGETPEAVATPVSGMQPPQQQIMTRKPSGTAEVTATPVSRTEPPEGQVAAREPSEAAETIPMRAPHMELWQRPITPHTAPVETIGATEQKSLAVEQQGQVITHAARVDTTRATEREAQAAEPEKPIAAHAAPVETTGAIEREQAIEPQGPVATHPAPVETTDATERQVLAAEATSKSETGREQAPVQSAERAQAATATPLPAETHAEAIQFAESIKRPTREGAAVSTTAEGIELAKPSTRTQHPIAPALSEPAAVTGVQQAAPAVTAARRTRPGRASAGPFRLIMRWLALPNQPRVGISPELAQLVSSLRSFASQPELLMRAAMPGPYVVPVSKRRGNRIWTSHSLYGRNSPTEKGKIPEKKASKPAEAFFVANEPGLFQTANSILQPPRGIELRFPYSTRHGRSARASALDASRRVQFTAYTRGRGDYDSQSVVGPMVASNFRQRPIAQDETAPVARAELVSTARLITHRVQRAYGQPETISGTGARPAISPESPHVYPAQREALVPMAWMIQPRSFMPGIPVSRKEIELAQIASRTQQAEGTERHATYMAASGMMRKPEQQVGPVAQAPLPRAIQSLTDMLHLSPATTEAIAAHREPTPTILHRAAMTGIPVLRGTDLTYLPLPVAASIMRSMSPLTAAFVGIRSSQGGVRERTIGEIRRAGVQPPSGGVASTDAAAPEPTVLSPAVQAGPVPPTVTDLVPAQRISRSETVHRDEPRRISAGPTEETTTGSLAEISSQPSTERQAQAPRKDIPARRADSPIALDKQAVSEKVEDGAVRASPPSMELASKRETTVRKDYRSPATSTETGPSAAPDHTRAEPSATQSKLGTNPARRLETAPTQGETGPSTSSGQALRRLAPKQSAEADLALGSRDFPQGDPKDNRPVEGIEAALETGPSLTVVVRAARESRGGAKPETSLDSPGTRGASAEPESVRTPILPPVAATADRRRPTRVTAPILRELEKAAARHGQDWPVVEFVHRLATSVAIPAQSTPAQVLLNLPQTQTPAVLTALAALPTMLGAGQRLSSVTRQVMQTIQGRDLSQVRIHTSPVAAMLGAEAFTTGQQIVFAPGQFETTSAKGMALLGHELAHLGQPLAFKRTVGAEAVPVDAAEHAARERESQVQHIMENGWPRASWLEVRRKPWPTDQKQEQETTLAIRTERMLPPTELRLSRVEIPAATTGTRRQVIQRAPLQGSELVSPQERQVNQENAKPDVDALAREVYAILKARLRAERDRHRLYGI